MTQNTSGFTNWFTTDKCRAKAEIKYDIKQLEHRLAKQINELSHPSSTEELRSLIASICDNYRIYLNVLQPEGPSVEFDSLRLSHPINHFEQLNKAIQLKNELSGIITLEVELLLVTKLTCCYYLLANNQWEASASFMCSPFTKEDYDLGQLFKKATLKEWILTLIDIWNHDNNAFGDSSTLFLRSSKDDYEMTLNYFSNPDVVDFINAAFFYKLYPDKLFAEFIHPEKLVSVRMRVGLLHEIIEQLQEQLYNMAFHFGLQTSTDLIFHGDELPQGILIEVAPQHTELLQLAIKSLKVNFTPENNEQINIERLHDLRRAYKFWFNPNRLIDAVMVLLQRLVKEEKDVELTFSNFHAEMIVLYKKLTTTECFDLYGYFSNNDSRCLLYTLELIISGKSLDWLPSLREIERNAVQKVYRALKSVMEVLRIELKNRHVSTEPYKQPENKAFEVDRRNREAVFRIIEVYGCENTPNNDLLEKLFHDMEDDEHKY
ncbi:hypothetical protein [Legionella waltersii]|uniref:Uncharacterized protein n=1 Tax=Legionella waltersii TaxID=66969 RepID=A0A0W1AJQ6_9GAMM|nr:hypothetical protein [Legionella waltersii]KTD81595.1 hypothetical protein Lwal_1032 [Legionella waltersii]SNV13173.1 Uncharacterised protein [Legionella waltersii]